MGMGRVLILSSTSNIVYAKMKRTVLASPVTKPVGETVSQPIVSDESEKTLPELKVSSPEFPLPPNDDADLEFDLASLVKNRENTPERNNLEESKVVASKATKIKVAAAASLLPKFSKKKSFKEAKKTKPTVVDAAKSKPAKVKTLDNTTIPIVLPKVTSSFHCLMRTRMKPIALQRYPIKSVMQFLECEA
jgi:hypothetical protein